MKRSDAGEPIAEKEIELFGLMEIVILDFFLFKSALKTQKLNQLSYWDSLIIVAADHSGGKTLYSENLNNGQKILDTTIVNPFADE